MIDPCPAEVFSVDPVLLFDDRGNHQLLAFHAVLRGTRLAHPIVAFSVVMIGQQLIERAVLTFDSFPGPSFDSGAHRRADMAAGNAAEELLAQTH